MPPDPRVPRRVLFVCTGNICRSPTADGVFRKRIADLGAQDRIMCDSAGTHGYHIGEPPDSRTQAHAAQRGYDLSALRARKVAMADFIRFDLILAMDRSNLAFLRDLCPARQRQRIALYGDYSARFAGQEVPDPYYGGISGFEQVLDMIEETSQQLLRGLLESEAPD